MVILIIIFFFLGLGFAIYGLLPSRSSRPIQRKSKKSTAALKLPADFPKEKNLYSDGQIQALNPELERLRSDYANLEAEISALRKKESEFQSELFKRDEWVKNSDEALKKARERAGEFEGKFVNKEKELQLEFARNVDLSRDVRELKLTQGRLENEKKSLSEENERMKHQLQRLAEEQKLNQQAIAGFKKQQEASQWVAKQDFVRLNEEYSELEKKLEQQENKK